MTRRSQLIFGSLTLALLLVGGLIFVQRDASSSGPEAPLKLTAHKGGADGSYAVRAGREHNEESSLIAKRRDFASELKRVLYSKRNAQRTIALREITSEWAKKEPRVALSFLESLRHEPMRDELLQAAFREWAESDTLSAIQYGKQMTDADSEHFSAYFVPLFEAITETEGIGGAIAYVQSRQNVEQALNGFSPSFKSYMRSDLERARELIPSLPNEQLRRDMHEMVGILYGMREGWAALEILEADYGEHLDAAFFGTLSALHRQEPEKVAQWLGTRPAAPELDRIRYNIAIMSANQQPDVAAKAAADIIDPSFRRQVLGTALENWLARDYEAAEEWAINSNVPAEEIAASIINRAPKDDSFYLGKIYEASGNPEDRGRLRTQVLYFRAWARVHPESAESWLSRSDLPAEAKAAFRGMIIAKGRNG